MEEQLVLWLLSLRRNKRQMQMLLYSKTKNVLSKVKISGGGRCNVTNACMRIAELCKNYPRGGKKLKKSFEHFYTKDTIEWFEARGVSLKTEADGRMFPESNDSQTIVECLVRALKKVGAKLATQSFVTQITPLKKALSYPLTMKSCTLTS